MYMAIGGALLWPVDAVMARLERRIYESASDPYLPLIFVCGPPRSGTTLVAQYLIDCFEVSYFSNVTSLFPQAPLLAMQLFGQTSKEPVASYNAFYGRSRHLSGVNDALYIWDRWLGPRRGEEPRSLVPDSPRAIRAFFGALQKRYRRPVVNKNNRLNVCAHLVAEVLPTATFVCLRREPVALAQSLHIARESLIGNLDEPYGVRHPRRYVGNAVEDIARQVEFFEEKRIEQQERIGADRFITLNYEEFCERPFELAESLQARFPSLEYRHGKPIERTFKPSIGRRLPVELFEQYQRRLGP